MRVHVRQQLSGGRLRLVEAGTGGRQRGQADVCCLAAAFEFEADLELEGALQLLLLQADGEFTRVLELLGQLQRALLAVCSQPLCDGRWVDELAGLDGRRAVLQGLEEGIRRGVRHDGGCEGLVPRDPRKLL